MKNIHDLNNKKGITVIEILIIVIFFGVIASFTVVSLNNSRRDTRDIKRLADIARIRDALSLYYYNCNKFPVAVNPGNSISGEECDGGVYLDNVPSDPTGIPYLYTPCIGVSEYRCASGQDGATWYELKYSLEGNSSELSSGSHIATPDRFY